MGYYSFNPAKIVSGSPIIYDDVGQQLIALSHTGGTTTLSGAEAAGDDIILKANAADTYPFIKMLGNGGFQFQHAVGSYFTFFNGNTPYFRTTYATNLIDMRGANLTGDDFLFRANNTDTYPSIKLLGNEGIEYRARANYHKFYYQATEILTIRLSSAHAALETPTDLDLYLRPQGTGRVRFGTYTAKGAEAFAGYIDMKDAGGTTRKVMVCA